MDELLARREEDEEEDEEDELEPLPTPRLVLPPRPAPRAAEAPQVAPPQVEQPLQPEPLQLAAPLAPEVAGQREASARLDRLEHSLTPGEAPEAPPELDPLEGYEELDVLGSGGAGVVTLARERATGAQVAIKRLRRPIDRARFLQEAQAISSLDHPNVVRLLRVLGGEHPDQPLALVLEHVPGPDLERLVQRSGRLTLQQALAIGIDLADALAHAHARGLVHRDVKPSNVLMSAGRAKLTDFGLALAVEAQLSITPSGTSLGTPCYMAPEQLEGPHEVDGRADVYGVGATLYRLLAGRSPRVIRERHLPEPARALVLRCVEEDPSDRYPDMPTLAAALRRLATRVQDPGAEVQGSLARVTRELKLDLERGLARDAGRRLLVAASGLTNLELLPPDAPARLRAQLELGGSWREALEQLVDTIEAQARRRGRERPRLLRDAHAILSAALAGQGELARPALRRLAEAGREPVRESPARRLSAVLARLRERGALSADDLRALSARSGPGRVVLEGALTRIRLRAEEGADPLPAVRRARWALGELAVVLPEWSERIEQEDLALALREAAEYDRVRRARLEEELEAEQEQEGASDG
ncbi:MAG: serine/threonine-protein kinase [Planctomycetota bacterium]